MKKNLILSLLVIVFISLFFQSVSAGCVGATYDFGCGATVNESCTLNGNMNCVGVTTNGLVFGGNNLVIDGNGYYIASGTSTAGHVIYMASKQNNIVKNIAIFQNTTSTAYAYAFYDNGGINNTIINSSLYALKSISSKHVLVTSGAINFTAKDCNVSTTGASTGVYILGGSSNATLINLRVNSSAKAGFPFYIHTSQNATLINNSIYSAYELPIMFYLTTTWAENATLEGNKIYVNGAWKDVWFNKSLSNLEIANIDFKDYGEVICLNCNNVTFRNDTFWNHALHVASYGQKHTIIKDSIFYSNNSASIFAFYHTNLTIFNNTFIVNETDNTKGYKYAIDLRNSGNFNISWNNISTYGNNDYAIQISGSPSTIDYIEDNNIYTNHTNARDIYMIKTVNDVVRRNNLTIDRAGYCAYYYSSSINNTFTNNNCYLFGDASQTIRGVVVYYNAHYYNISDNYFELNSGVSSSNFAIVTQRNVSNVWIERNVFNFTGNNYNKIGIYNYDNNPRSYLTGGTNIFINNNTMFGNTDNASTAYAYIASYNATGMSIDNLTINHENGGMDMIQCYETTTPSICQIDIKNTLINRSGSAYSTSYDVQFGNGVNLSNSWINLTNVSYNESLVLFSTTPKADLNVKNYLDVKVNYSNGTNINGASVLGYWENNSLIFNETTGKYGIRDSLIAEYRFNEGSGDIAYDSSGNNLHCNISGAIYETGVEGTGLKFDGVNDYANCSNSSLFNFGNKFTMETWFKTGNNNTYQRLLTKNYSVTSGEYGYSFAFRTDGTIWGAIRLNSSYQGISAPYPYTNTFNTNTWYHIATTYDGEMLKLYINGRLVKTSYYYGATINQDNSGEFLLGRNAVSSEFFNGTLDDVRLYNKSLTQEEVLINYNSDNRSDGYIGTEILDSYIQNITTRLNYSNYKINVSVDGKTDEEVFNITSSIFKWLTIDNIGCIGLINTFGCLDIVTESCNLSGDILFNSFLKTNSYTFSNLENIINLSEEWNNNSGTYNSVEVSEIPILSFIYDKQAYKSDNKSITTKIKIQDDGTYDYVGLIGNFDNNTEEYYLCAYTNDGGQYVGLYKCNTITCDNLEIIDEYEFFEVPEFDRWYDMGLRIDNGNITCYFDDNYAYGVDTSIKKGYLGFGNLFGNVSFDNTNIETDVRECFSIYDSNIDINGNGFKLSGNGIWDNSTGIYTEGENISIKNINISNFFYGIFTNQGESVNISNSSFYYNGKSGVFINETNKVNLSNNIFNNTYLTSNDSLTQYFCNFTEPTFLTTEANILLCSSDNSTIYNNSFYGNGTQGISNHDGTEAGIAILYSDYVLVDSNRFYNSGDNYGIFAGAFNNYGTFVNNYVDGWGTGINSNDGIILKGHNNNVSFNNFKNNDEWNLFLAQCENSTIEGNYFNGTNHIGDLLGYGTNIRVGGENSSYNIIKNNVGYNANVGIRLEGSHNLIENNNFYNYNLSGLLIKQYAIGIYPSGNVLYNTNFYNGGIGIYNERGLSNYIINGYFEGYNKSYYSEYGSLYLLDCSFDKDKTLVSSIGKVYNAYSVNAKVISDFGNIDGANVTVYSNTSAFIFSDITNSSGYTGVYNLTEFYENSSGKEYYSYNFIVKKDTQEITKNVFIEIAQTVIIKINAILDLDTSQQVVFFTILLISGSVLLLILSLFLGSKNELVKFSGFSVGYLICLLFLFLLTMITKTIVLFPSLNESINAWYYMFWILLIPLSLYTCGVLIISIFSYITAFKLYKNGDIGYKPTFQIKWITPIH